MKLFVLAALVATVSGVRFELKDDEGKDCILLDAEGTLSLKATGGGSEVYSKSLKVVKSANVTGSCANDTSSSATMRVDFGPKIGVWALIFQKGDPVLLDQTFSFSPSQLLNESLPSGDVIVAQADHLKLSAQNASFECNVELQVLFNNTESENFTYSLTQTITTLRVQAFNLENNTYSPADQCSQESTTQEPTTQESTTQAPTTQMSPVNPTPDPTQPTKYEVSSSTDNVTCIVFQAIIIFNNFTYTKEDNTTGTTNDVSIPFANETSSIVRWSGSCGEMNTTTNQSLAITFNKNWTLTLMFARGAASDESLLTAASDEYYLRDIELQYYLDSTIFTNVSAADAGKVQTANHMNISGDVLKGQLGGSYKCDADVTQNLEGGVVFETKSLQYKAFNTDANADFSSDNVSECPADDESNSIVPIAVGAALAGLVVIVLIAYLIGRRRSRRQGYESV